MEVADDVGDEGEDVSDYGDDDREIKANEEEAIRNAEKSSCLIREYPSGLTPCLESKVTQDSLRALTNKLTEPEVIIYVSTLID